MTHRNGSITHETVIPVIESHLFDGIDARFAVGILAVNDQVVPGLENEYAGYYNLRRDVYVYQTGQLDESELNADGTDRDIDDSRSIALGVIENRGTDQRVVGAMRLIVKDSMNEPLPVEEFCPEIFANHPAPERSIEVSRFISRHEKRSAQNMAKWLIYGASLVQVSNRNLGPTYAIIEPALERDLASTVPITRIGEPRYVAHYLADNLPIQVDTDAFIESATRTLPKMMNPLIEADGAMTYFGSLLMPAAADQV